MFHLGIEPVDIVKMAQRAENAYVGVQCGIMDQFANMFGKDGHVIKLDCRSLDYEYRRLDMNGFRVVLFDSGIRHALASSEYNIRRMECDAGVAMIQAVYPEVKKLRDATMQMLDHCVLPVDPLVYKRCRYVIEELQRLEEACASLERNDISTFGKKMFGTHAGLSGLYGVSCEELDFLVAAVKDNPVVLGARMMGGGFGGCTINLIQEDAIETLYEKLRNAYAAKFGIGLKMYITSIEQGTAVIDGK